MKRPLVLVATSVMLVAAACGGNDKPAAAPTPAVFNTPCTSPKAPSKNLPKLPSGFPTPDGVVYVSGSKAGPSTIVYGYYPQDLTQAHTGWADALKGAGYTITHEEQDPADAEVNFSGDQTTGQVRLQESCKGRSLVTVTIRPD